MIEEKVEKTISKATINNKLFKYECQFENFGLDIKKYNLTKFKCVKCLLDSVCDFCIKNCHKDCFLGGNTPVGNEYDSFICACGYNRNHKNDVRSFDKNCVLKNVEKVLIENNSDSPFCMICETLCEKSEETDKKEVKIGSVYDERCQCENEKHSTDNLFFVEKIENSENFYKIKAKLKEEFKEGLQLPVQLLNVILENANITHILNKIYGNKEDSIIESTINLFEVAVKELEVEQKSDLANKFPNYHEVQNQSDLSKPQFLNLREYLYTIRNHKFQSKFIKFLEELPQSNFKHFFFIALNLKLHHFFELLYSSKRLNEIFNFEKIMAQLVFRCDESMNNEISIMIKLASIIHSTHLKKDFRLIKKLSTYDFLTLGIHERKNLREFLNSDNYQTREIYQKYFKNIKNSNSSLKNFFKKDFIISIMNKCIKGEIIYYNEIAKLFIFLLKYVKFELSELEDLIRLVYESVVATHHVSGYFGKFIFILTIYYNDLIFEKNNGTSKKEQKYVQVIDSKQKNGKNDVVEKLSKIVALIYNDTKLESNKDINIFHFPVDFYLNENMKLFLNPDNFYRQQMELYKLKKLEEYNLFDNKNNSSYNFEVQLNEQIDSRISDYFNFRNKLDKKIKTNEEMSNDKLFKDITSIIKNFPFERIFEKSSGERNLGNNHFSKKIITMLKKSNEEEKISEHKPFKFLHNIVNEERIKELVNYLTINSVDEIVTFTLAMNQNMTFGKKENVNTDQEEEEEEREKIKIYNDNFKDLDILYYNNDDFEFILNFLKLFLMNKKGVRHFCLGKNLIRIINLFEKYPLIIMNFLFILFKVVKHYKIDLKNHKAILKMKIKLFAHLDDIKKGHNEMEIIHQALLIIKIFNKTSHFYSEEDLKDIQIKLINTIPFFNESKILNSKYKERDYNLTDKNEENDIGTDFSINNDGYQLINDKSDTIQKQIKVFKFYNRNDKFSEFELYYLFHFEFFELISQNVYLMYYLDAEDEKLYITIKEFLDKKLEEFKDLANTNYISIFKRKIFLRFMRTVYFIEKIDKESFHSTDDYQYLKDDEYFLILKILDKRYVNDLTIPNSTKLEKSLKNIKPGLNEYLYEKHSNYETMVKNLKFIKKELDYMTKLRHNSLMKQKYLKYVKELVFTVKQIVDKYIVYRETTTKMIKILNKLIKSFVKRVPQIADILIFFNPNLKKSLNYEVEEIKMLRDTLKKKTYSFDKVVLHNFFSINFENIFKNLDESVCPYTYINKHEELNYAGESLNNDEKYAEFEKEEQFITVKLTKEEIRINDAIEIYEKQFTDKDNLSILGFRYNINYEKIPFKLIWKFFKDAISQKNSLDRIYSILLIINKFLFYNTAKIQEIIDEKTLKEVLNHFYEFFKINLKKNLIYSRNSLSNEKNLEMTLMSQESIRFIQLLSENQNRRFHDIIFEFKIPHSKVPVFEYILNTFLFLYNYLFQKFQNYCLPDDQLILMLNSISDTIIEYIQTADDTYYQRILYKFEGLLTAMFSDKQSDTNKKYENNSFKNLISIHRYNIQCFCRNKLFEILIELFKFKKSKTDDEHFRVAKFFEEIETVFMNMLKYFKIALNVNKEKKRDFSKKLLELYCKDKEFRNNYQLKLSLNIFYLIKIFSDVHKLPKFIEFIYKIEKNSNEISSEIKYIYSFLNKILLKIEVQYEDDNEIKKTYYFFIRPYKTMFLKNNTKNNFIDKVPRDTAFMKLNTLKEKTDYFIFEMICYYNMKQNDLKLPESGYTYIQWLNMIFILFNQLFLMINFYHSPGTSVAIYNKVSEGMVVQNYNNFITTCLQTIFLLYFIKKWIDNEYPFVYQEKIMEDSSNKFIFKDPEYNNYENLKKIFNEEVKDAWNIIQLVNSRKVKMWHNIKTKISSIITNRKINFLILSLIFNIVYLLTENLLFLVIQIAFVANLFSILFNILSAVVKHTDKWMTVLLFNYLVVYILSWLSMMWFSSFFSYDAINASTGETISENYCTSSLQCFLFMIDYGTRSGGGIGDQLPMLSYKDSTTMYYLKWLFDMLFFIFIVLIMGNIFLGIIVDSFGELRDQTQRDEEDKKEKCFICQMTRSDTVKNQINFEKHKKEDHNMWYYVYFLTELYMTQYDELDPIQRLVYKKNQENDISWIPIYDDSDSENKDNKKGKDENPAIQHLQSKNSIEVAKK